MFNILSIFSDNVLVTDIDRIFSDNVLVTDKDRIFSDNVLVTDKDRMLSLTYHSSEQAGKLAGYMGEGIAAGDFR